MATADCDCRMVLPSTSSPAGGSMTTCNEGCASRGVSTPCSSEWLMLDAPDRNGVGNRSCEVTKSALLAAPLVRAGLTGTACARTACAAMLAGDNSLELLEPFSKGFWSKGVESSARKLPSCSSRSPTASQSADDVAGQHCQ